MIAITSPPSNLPHQSSNHHENLHRYVSAQIRQLSPERSSRASMARTAQRQGNAQGVENQRPIRRVATEVPGRPMPNGVSAAEHDDIGTTVNGGDQSAKPGALVRFSTDLGPRRRSVPDRPDSAEDNWVLRHGWDEQYNSAEYLSQLTAVSDMKFQREEIKQLTLGIVAILHVLHRQATRDGRKAST